MTSGEARAALGSGKVWLGDVPVSDGGRDVDPADVRLRPRAPRLTPGRDPVLVYRDDDVIVAYKPSGMLSVPAPGRDGGSLLGAMGKLVGSVLAVHRLDEGTSGLLMFARSAESQAKLKDQLEQHTVERRYLALVAGTFPAKERTIRSVLVRDRGDGLRGSADEGEEGGREAVTHLRLIEHTGGGVSLIEARLETGRTHQVRIHCAEARHPVLGDPLYAPQQISQRAPRLALHATVLGFAHPRTGEPMRFFAPLADDLEVARRGLAHVVVSPRRGRVR